MQTNWNEILLCKTVSTVPG